MRGGVEVQSSIDYKKWLSEQETFKELIAKQQKIEFENKKIVKNNNFRLYFFARSVNIISLIILKHKPELFTDIRYLDFIYMS